MAIAIPANLTQEQLSVRELSERLVKLQGPIRVLDAIKWDDEVKRQFFANGCKELPKISADYYAKRSLSYDPQKKIQEFLDFELEVQKRLGKISGLSLLLQRMSREYRDVVRMVQARGTPEFGLISRSLYGSSEDAFYVDGPTNKDLAGLLSKTLPKLRQQTEGPADEKIYNSQQAVEILSERFKTYFTDPEEAVRVEISDSIIADASAGAEVVKIRSDAKFSERDLKVLEVHEGWVHLGTTLNGLNQPICTFLSKGPPSSTSTQEGLAVITEVFTFSMYPARLQRLTDRILAINQVENGANFIEVFNFYRAQGHGEDESYALAVRVFRGGYPEGGAPFTKDLVYSRGFVLIYNYIRLAIRAGVLNYIPLLFLGKTTLEDLPLLYDLVQEGYIKPPKYMPPQFRDLAALSSWMSFSLFMNMIDVEKMAMDFRGILRG